MTQEEFKGCIRKCIIAFLKKSEEEFGKKDKEGKVIGLSSFDLKRINKTIKLLKTFLDEVEELGLPKQEEQCPKK